MTLNMDDCLICRPSWVLFVVHFLLSKWTMSLIWYLCQACASFNSFFVLEYMYIFCPFKSVVKIVFCCSISSRTVIPWQVQLSIALGAIAVLMLFFCILACMVKRASLAAETNDEAVSDVHSIKCASIRPAAMATVSWFLRFFAEGVDNWTMSFSGSLAWAVQFICVLCCSVYNLFDRLTFHL